MDGEHHAFVHFTQPRCKFKTGLKSMCCGGFGDLMCLASTLSACNVHWLLLESLALTIRKVPGADCINDIMSAITQRR